MKKIKNYLLAFLIPLIICIIFLYFKGALNDIEELYVSDLRLQHIGFLSYLKNVLLGKASIYYTFTAGLGSSMISTIIFYCISPLNLLLIMIDDIRYAIIFVYIIKIALAGLTMYILLRSKLEKDSFMTVVFATCYALCSFVINYFFCVFWFDSLYLAPLVVLGIDRMFKTRKLSLLYILSLALAIACNIQMGFGLCVFSVIYFIYSYNIRYDIKKEFREFIRYGILFAISSLCAGAISSGFLLGFVSSYGDITASREIVATTKVGVANIGYILKNLFVVGNYKQDYFNSFEPFINCGLLVSFFAILFLFNKNIDKKKRIHSLGVILVFVISFCVEFINLFWHLSSPVLLNFRYSAYLSLFLTMMAYECYIMNDRLEKKDVTILVVSLIVAFLIIIGYSSEIYVGYTFCFLILVLGLILLTKNKNKKFEILLVLLVFIELGINGYLSIYTASQLPLGKVSSLDSLNELASKNDFGDSYRVLYDYSYTDITNDTLLLNKNSSLRYFSSVINGKVSNFFNHNGVNVGNNNYRFSAYDSPLMLSLFSNRYFYLTEEINNGIYKKLDTYEITSYDYIQGKMDTKKVYLYENPYALSLGYVIQGEAEYEDKMKIADYQNKLIKAFTGTNQDVMINLGYMAKDNEKECEQNNKYPSCRGYTLRNMTSNTFTYVYTYLSEYSTTTQSKIYVDGVRPLLISTVEDSIELVLKSDGDLKTGSFDVLTYDENNLVKALDILRENSLTDINIDKNIMTAKIDSNKDGILFLTVPYSDKYTIYVDGKETEYYAIQEGAFVGLDIIKGKHDIKLVYAPNDLKLYVISSLSSLIITFVVYYLMNKQIDKKLVLEEQARMIQEENRKKSKKKKRK